MFVRGGSGGDRGLTLGGTDILQGTQALCTAYKVGSQQEVGGMGWQNTPRRSGGSGASKTEEKSVQGTKVSQLASRGHGAGDSSWRSRALGASPAVGLTGVRGRAKECFLSLPVPLQVQTLGYECLNVGSFKLPGPMGWAQKPHNRPLPAPRTKTWGDLIAGLWGGRIAAEAD